MRRQTVANTGLRVVLAVCSGAAVGAVVGGVGSRIAMRLIAIWTDGPAFTLNGAEVGEVTLDGTLSLMGSTAQAGAIGGLLYATIRSALPSSKRALMFALLTVLLPGGFFLGDAEFELFDPPMLAAVLFLPVFAACGLVLVALVERVDPQTPRRWTRNRRYLVAAVAVLGLAVMIRNVAELV